MRGSLHQGHIHPQVTPEGRELDPDHPAAEDDGPFRQPLQPQRVLAREDALPIGRQAEGDGNGPGRQDDIAGPQQLATDRQSGAAGIHHQPSAAPDHLDAAGTDQPRQPPV